MYSIRVSFSYLPILLLFLLIFINKSISVSENISYCSQILRSNEISCSPKHVKFFLFPNSRNIYDFDELKINVDSIERSRFDPRKGLIIIVHGFLQNFTTNFPQFTKNKYLETGYSRSTNIIIVDWGRLSASNALQPISNLNLAAVFNSVYYLAAVENVKTVSDKLYSFLLLLYKHNYALPERTHLIGLSLGAHISGTTGKYIKQATRKKIDRITGLDPAGPLYQGSRQLEKYIINREDAKLVDIYHVNQGEFGYFGNLGTVDFYINGGGPIQPGCLNRVLYCAHATASIYYGYSIGNSAILAKPSSCSTPILGELCPKIIFGENMPYSVRGPYNVKIQLSLNDLARVNL